MELSYPELSKLLVNVVDRGPTHWVREREVGAEWKSERSHHVCVRNNSNQWIGENDNTQYKMHIAIDILPQFFKILHC